MGATDFVLARGLKDTRLALRRWNDAPASVLGPWLAVSGLIAGGVLAAVLITATFSPPDSTRFVVPGLNAPAAAADYLYLLYRNSLVLALHAMACIAGFMAGSSMPLAAASRRGFLLLGLLPHALLELMALFLPLGAWLLASRRGTWNELLAATVVTVAIAVPVLLISAVVELWVSPDLLRALPT